MSGVAGSERYLENIVPALKVQGIDASFLVIQHPNNSEKNIDFISNLRNKDITVYILNSYVSISPIIIFKLIKIIKNNKFDILQSNLIYSDFIAAIVKIFLPKLLLISVKHGYDEIFQTKYGLNYKKLKLSLFSFITKWSAKRANRVICISKALNSFLCNGKLVSKEKLVTVPYGFNFANMQVEDVKKKVRYGSPQIIITGRLEAVKQHDIFLRVIPELLKIFPDLSVLMVGDGSLKGSLKNISAELGISKHIQWLGFQKNVHAYIQASDVMVIPSSAEGFGLVVLESWFHAKPVIAFDVPAINEIVEDGVDGILVSPFSESSLLTSIIKILKDKNLSQQYGLSGQIKQNNLYDIKTMTNKTIKVLNDLYLNNSK